VGLRDHLAPFLIERLGASYEKKPEVMEGRRKLVAAAGGRVLEIGAGTGFNLPYYPPGVSELVLTDALDGMLRRAEKRARESSRAVVTTRSSVESLPYPDGSFDTVVGSFLLCSVDDQNRALAEIRRVLAPGGRYLFLEHVRSEDPRLAHRQDQLAGIWKVVAFGCHPNRHTLASIESTFEVEEVERDEMPYGPKIVRPYVIGQAVAR
jgi:ubiquinone/menaquinone biosynthesis C-methylase UbiE